MEDTGRRQSGIGNAGTQSCFIFILHVNRYLAVRHHAGFSNATVTIWPLVHLDWVQSWDDGRILLFNDNQANLLSPAPYSIQAAPFSPLNPRGRDSNNIGSSQTLL